MNGRQMMQVTFTIAAIAFLCSYGTGNHAARHV
jgi:hypothetical protein